MFTAKAMHPARPQFRPLTLCKGGKEHVLVHCIREEHDGELTHAARLQLMLGQA